MRRNVVPPNFRHYVRVRVGPFRLPGRLLRCESKRQPNEHYWRVKLDDGRWVPPVDVILDGPGEKVSTCPECEMAFMSKAGGGLCDYCENLIYGTRAQRRETEDRIATGNMLRVQRRKRR